MSKSERGFAAALIRWQARHGRHDLPWAADRDPYRVWLSEIMLQQTQVAAVVPYYLRWLDRFPDLAHLARARADVVMQHWAGLGYYARARNLHACAKQIVREHAGRFPTSAAELARLPGIGPSTAAAIAAFCFSERAAIVDGNVKRVLARYFGIDDPLGTATAEHRLAELAQQQLPAAAAMPAYTQAIMDLGATVCRRTRPSCETCPVVAGCVAKRTKRIAELPRRRVKAPVPTRRAHMLVALVGGASRPVRVLLRRRPASGVWGSLWSLPQAAQLAALRADTGDIVPVSARWERWPIREHAFTHFVLRWTPHLVRLPATTATGSDLRWQSLERLGDAGMPAPIRRLLEDIRDQDGP